jgi:hypothetical protein
LAPCWISIILALEIQTARRETDRPAGDQSADPGRERGQPALEPLPAAIRDIAWKAQIRLCARYRRLAAAGKPKVVVTTAIAREMTGFIWAIAQIAQPPLSA